MLNIVKALAFITPVISLPLTDEVFTNLTLASQVFSDITDVDSYYFGIHNVNHTNPAILYYGLFHPNDTAVDGMYVYVDRQAVPAGLIPPEVRGQEEVPDDDPILRGILNNTDVGMGYSDDMANAFDARAADEKGRANTWCCWSMCEITHNCGCRDCKHCFPTYVMGTSYKVCLGF